MTLGSPNQNRRLFERRFRALPASDVDPLIESGQLLERTFASSEELWEFVPDWVHETLLAVFMRPDVFGRRRGLPPDPGLTVTTVWEGATGYGTVWVFQVADLNLTDDPSFDFVTIERSPT